MCFQLLSGVGAVSANALILLSYLILALSCRIAYLSFNKREKAMYGDVYINCPFSGELMWYDHCSHEDYANRYGIFDAGRFLWVGGK